jgi:hypothetical protein
MAAIAICSSMILVIHTQHNHGTNQNDWACPFMHSRFHGCNRTQCKAWQKKKYEAGTKKEMNWTCPMNKLFLDQSNGMKCYRIMKIIPQAFHRVPNHQNRNPEWKIMPKLRCAENRAIGWSDSPIFVSIGWTPEKKKTSA